MPTVEQYKEVIEKEVSKIFTKFEIHSERATPNLLSFSVYCSAFGESFEESISYPANWLEAIKERFLVKWFKPKYTIVKFTTDIFYVDVEGEEGLGVLLFPVYYPIDLHMYEPAPFVHESKMGTIELRKMGMGMQFTAYDNMPLNYFKGFLEQDRILKVKSYAYLVVEYPATWLDYLKPSKYRKYKTYKPAINKPNSLFKSRAIILVEKYIDGKLVS